MNFPPPEPDPATALICPDCGEPISPEGMRFLGYRVPKKKKAKMDPDGDGEYIAPPARGSDSWVESYDD